MINENIQYIQNANKTYPQWNDITLEMAEKFKGFHQILRTDGYNIKGCNIAEKDGKLFWILLDETKENFKLEQYGFLKNE